MNLTFGTFDLTYAIAEVWLIAAACGILLVDVFLSDRRRGLTPILALLSVAVAAYLTYQQALPGRVTSLNGFYVADPMGNLLKLFAYGAVAVSFVYARDYLTKRNLFKGEYYVLGLFALVGINVLVSAGSLLTIYLGVEL